MSTNQDKFKKIVSHAKEYGFIFQSSEIYDGLSAVYDYAQNGVELKNNIKNYWWSSMVQMNDNIVGLDSSILMHPTTWKASGHVDAFNDPLIDNKDSKLRYRADVLIEDYIAKIETKINKEIVKAKKRFGDAFDENEFRKTNIRVLENQKKIDNATSKMKKCFEDDDLVALKQLIVDLEISDPVSGSKNWTHFFGKLEAQNGRASDHWVRGNWTQASHWMFCSWTHETLDASRNGVCRGFLAIKVGHARTRNCTPREQNKQ